MQSVPNFVQFNANVDVICPYCGHKLIVSVKNGKEMKLVHCEEEEGGCGFDFTVRATVKADVEIERFRLKICDDNEETKQN